jgi:hypothetical protein
MGVRGSPCGTPALPTGQSIWTRTRWPTSQAIVTLQQQSVMCIPGWKRFELRWKRLRVGTLLGTPPFRGPTTTPRKGN